MSQDDVQVGRRLGPFVLEERLGDHGSVYHAIHVEHRRSIAVKRLDPLPAPNERAVQEFSRELLFLQTLQHPNVVTCYGGGVQELQPYLAIELVRGESLDVRLRRAGAIAWPQAMAIARQACDALGYCDHRNVQHFRLSPSKILLGDDGTTHGIVKVCDFRRPRGPIGLPEVEPSEQLTAMAYQAPEQICGKPPVSPATDVYALGCILFEMLVGRPPFEGRTPREIAQQHLTAVAPRVALLVPDCPVWLDALVAQLLEKLPQQRLQSASEVGVALDEAAHNVTANVSIAEHALSGAPSALRTKPADAAAQQLLPARKKKAGPQGPIYERVWFLGTCLAAIIAVVVWAMWPASDEKLLAEAQKLMAGEDRAAWDVARRDYLTPLLARSPSPDIAQPAQELLDRIEAEEARERMQRNLAQGRAPSSTGERLYLQARQFHDFGDLAGALARFQHIRDTLADSQSDRGFAKLAEQRVRELHQAPALVPQREFLEKKLQDADEFAAKGDLPAARRIWDRILSLYSAQDDVRLLYERAQQRRLGVDMKPVSKPPPSES